MFIRRFLRQTEKISEKEVIAKASQTNDMIKEKEIKPHKPSPSEAPHRDSAPAVVESEAESSGVLYSSSEAAKMLNISIITFRARIEDLPTQYIVNCENRLFFKQEAIDFLRIKYPELPENYLKMSELVRRLGTNTPTLYNFLHANHFYDLATKIGKKTKRYHCVAFSPELVKLIEAKFAEKKITKEKHNVVKLDTYIFKELITDGLIQFLEQKCEVHYINSEYYIKRGTQIQEFLIEYMGELGFVPLSEATIHMGISKQRMHQIIISDKVQDDESIIVRIRPKSTYISKEYLKKLMSQRSDFLPLGYYTLTELRASYKHINMKRICKGLNTILYNGRKHYNIEDVKPKLEEEEKKTILKNIELKNLKDDWRSSWLPLTEASRQLGINGPMLKDFLIKHEMNTSEYIRPVTPEQKTFRLNPAAIDILRKKEEDNYVIN